MIAFSPEVIERLGWLLIHSLWQFAVIATFAAVIVPVLRRRSATMRYGVLVAAMVMMVVAPCSTWIFIPAHPVSPTASASGSESIASLHREADAVPVADATPKFQETSQTPVSPMASASGYETSESLYREADAQPLADVARSELLRPWFSWIVGGWLIGVLLCSFRPLLGWRMLRRLRRIGISPPSEEVLAAFARVSQRLSLQRVVKVFHSMLATGPLVVGYLRPIVLLPVSLVTSIPIAQLEAILAHELAHIRRHDFIINLAQTLMETLFFYHPAIWWLSRRIRIEREHCCDDLVINLFDNGVEYGRALLAIEQLHNQRSVLALGATDGSLLGRIRRITGSTSRQPRFIPFFTMAIAAVVFGAMWMSVQGFLYGASDEAKKEESRISEDNDDSSETELRRLKADLPSGSSVELLGVTDAIQNSDGQWWNPDGTSLPASPIPGNSLDLTKKRTDGRVFAFRLTGSQAFNLPDIKVQFLKNGQPIKLLDRQKAWSESRITFNPQTRDSIVEFATGPTNDADSVSLEIPVSSRLGATITYNVHDQTRQDVDFSLPGPDLATNRLFRKFKFLRAGPHEGGFAMWTKPFSPHSDDGYILIGLYIEEGEFLFPPAGEPDGSEEIFHFRHMPEHVEQFGFQIHPYDNRIRIRNIAINAGSPTEPNITVEPIASERINEQEVRDTLSDVFRDSIEFVHAADGLEDLHVKDLPAGGWQFVSLLTGIRALQIQGGDLRNGPLRRIAKIPGLKSLSITQAQCVPDDLRALSDHLTLEELNVELSTPEALADEQQRGHIWIYTQFREREWIERNLRRLSKRFPDEVATRHRMEAAVLTDRSIWHLDDLKNLKSLRIVNSPVSGNSLRAFAELPNLQRLNIEVIDTNAVTGATLASFPSLRSFGTIEATPGVFPQLSFSKTLEELDVSWLNDDCVEDLLQISQLKRLHLRSSELSEMGLLKLAKLDQLTELSLIATKGTITDEGIARLRGLLPNCKLTIEKETVATAQKPADQQPAVAAEAPNVAQVSHFAGTVKDETDQPLAGAKIYITRQNSNRANPAPVRATTDAAGHFEFDAPEMTYTQVDGTPALYDGWLIATKEDYGTDFFQTRGTTYNGSLWSTISVNHGKIELQLTKDDVPVRGRLFDPEGQPLAGAQVTMKSIGVPRKFSLDAHLEREAAATQEGRIFTGAKIYERSLLEPHLVPGLVTEIQTDADGWFEFNGIGRERLVTLSVLHPLIQDAHLEVMTRVAPDVGTIRDLEGKPTQTIHGSGFTKQMPVGLTVRGIVRDRTTKKPLAGMWVTTKGHPIRYAAYNPNPAVTDENGRFIITGMNPIYATLAKEKRDIAAYPQPGMPYVMSGTHFETDGETIIECDQGIPFRLKVVDESGSPVSGDVHYVPISPNPVVFELMRENGLRDGTMDTAAREDETYEGIVLPGPGAVVFKARNGKTYRPAFVDPKAFFAPQQSEWPEHSNHVFGTKDDLSTVFGTREIQAEYEAIVLVNPTVDSGPLELSATVFNDRPRKVELIDADGKSVTGVESLGLWPERAQWSILNSPTFTLTRFYRNRLRQVMFNHKERNLTAILLADGDSDEPITVVMQTPATVTGRLVLKDGQRMKNPHLAVRATNDGADVLRLGKPGPDGNFRIEGLIPGLSFDSVNSGDVVRFTTLDGKPVENLILKPGEVRDLGDVRVVANEEI